MGYVYLLIVLDNAQTVTGFIPTTIQLIITIKNCCSHYLHDPQSTSSAIPKHLLEAGEGVGSGGSTSEQ